MNTICLSMGDYEWQALKNTMKITFINLKFRNKYANKQNTFQIDK